MKIFAGFMLYGKKPMQAPARIIRIIATAGSPMMSETRNMDKDDMQDIPAARPPNPSIQFTALVRPMIQRIVTGIESHPRDT